MKITRILAGLGLALLLLFPVGEAAAQTTGSVTTTVIELELSETYVFEKATTNITVIASYVTRDQASLMGPVTVTPAGATTVTISVDSVSFTELFSSSTTAAASTDFTAVSDFEIVIPANQASFSEAFDLITTDSSHDVDTAEGGVTLGVTGTATGFDVIPGTPGAPIIIVDDEGSPGYIDLSLSTTSVSEADASTVVTVTASILLPDPGSATTMNPGNSGTTNVVVSVAGASTDGATVGTDFEPVGSFTIAIPAIAMNTPGTFTKAEEFTLTVTDDNEAEPTEFLVISGAPPVAANTVNQRFFGIRSATLTITDNDDVAEAISVSLSPETVSESSGETALTVTASAPAGMMPVANTTVTVALGTAGSAESGTSNDFTLSASSVDLTFDGTERNATGTLVLTVNPDGEPEGDETLVFTATTTAVNPSTGYAFVISDATLTITEGQPEAEAELEEVLPEIARATVLSTVGAIADRVGQVAAAATGGVGGVAPLPRPATQLAQVLVTHQQGLNDGTVSLEEALSGVSLAGSPSGDSGSTGLWASADYGGFSSKHDDLGEWDGESFQLQLGADHRISDSDFLIGLAISSSWGEISFDDSETEIDTRLTGINPYVGWYSAELDANLWATLGYAAGKLDHKAESDTDQDLKVLSGAVGGSKRLPVDTEYEISVKGDVSATRITAEAAEDRPEVQASANRLRLALELGATEDLGDDLVSARSIALGLRHDGGDGDTGTGAELDGQVSYIGPEVSVTGYGKLLFVHSSPLREWSFGALVRYEPDQGRGLEFQLRPVYGTGLSQTGRIWDTATADLENRTHPGEPEARLSLDTGYGIPVLSGTALVTPYTGLDLGEGGVHTLRFGTRLETESDFRLDLSASRSAGDREPETGLGIVASYVW